MIIYFILYILVAMQSCKLGLKTLSGVSNKDY